MRSAAHIGGHPIHPMLICFPVAFLIGATGFDWASMLTSHTQFSWIGGWLSLAGIASGLVAAIPGLIDYIVIIPPNSSAKTRATWHMFVNVTALGLFALSWYWRDWQTFQFQQTALILEVIGVLAMTVGGHTGGTLVFRNQIGVDHRQPNSQHAIVERRARTSPSTIQVGNLQELHLNQMKLVESGSDRIAVGRCSIGPVAFSDRCPHRGASLADGTLAGCIVTCPWHGSQFDVNSGEVIAGPADSAPASYPLEQTGDDYWVNLTATAHQQSPSSIGSTSRLEK